METRELKKLFAAAEKIYSRDINTRQQLCSIGILGETEDSKRLCVCDGHMIAIFDLSKKDIEKAKTELIIFEKTFDGKSCYVTKKFLHLKEDGFFPYPDVYCAIPQLSPATEVTKKYFDPELLVKAKNLLSAYCGKTLVAFTHISKSTLAMDAIAHEGIFIGVMPLRTPFSSSETPQYDKISVLLPGLEEKDAEILEPCLQG